MNKAGSDIAMARVETEKLAVELAPVVTAEGCRLVDVEYKPGCAGALARLYIDKEEGSVTVDDCARVSQQVALVLEARFDIPGSYTLEVSSPGLTRPLKKPDDYRQCEGKLALVTVRSSAGHSGKLLGTIEKAGETSAFISTRPDGDLVEIPYHDIAKARLEIE